MKLKILQRARSASRTMLAAGAVVATLAPGQGMAHQPPGAEGAPEGILRASIVHEGGVDAMQVMILDAPQPAIMLSYRGEETLTVLDSDNQPFLRFHGDRVEASTQSRHWQTLPQSKGSEPGSETSWVRVSGSGSFGWVDPRLTAHTEGRPDQTTDWRIPVKPEASDSTAITGRLSWRPLANHASNTQP